MVSVRCVSENQNNNIRNKLKGLDPSPGVPYLKIIMNTL